MSQFSNKAIRDRFMYIFLHFPSDQSTTGARAVIKTCTVFLTAAEVKSSLFHFQGAFYCRPLNASHLISRSANLMCARAAGRKVIFPSPQPLRTLRRSLLLLLLGYVMCVRSRAEFSILCFLPRRRAAERRAPAIDTAARVSAPLVRAFLNRCLVCTAPHANALEKSKVPSRACRVTYKNTHVTRPLLQKLHLRHPS